MFVLYSLTKNMKLFTRCRHVNIATVIFSKSIFYQMHISTNVRVVATAPIYGGGGGHTFVSCPTNFIFKSIKLRLISKENVLSV